MSYTYDPSAYVVPTASASSVDGNNQSQYYDHYSGSSSAFPALHSVPQSAFVYPHHQPFVPGQPLTLQQQPQQSPYAYMQPVMGYQPQPLQPSNAGSSVTTSSSKMDAHKQEEHRTPIHAPGEPEGKLPYLLPDKMGVALGFPSQAPTIPTLGDCTAEGDLVTIRATGVPRWRLELKDEAWGAPIEAVSESKTATFRLHGACERTLTVRVCKANEDGSCGAFTAWSAVTAPPPPLPPAEESMGQPNEATEAATEVAEEINSAAANTASVPVSVPPAPTPPAFVAAGFASSADEEAEAARAAAVAVQAAARGHRTRLEAKAVRRGLSSEEAADFNGVPAESTAKEDGGVASSPSATPPALPSPRGLTSWASSLGVHKLLVAALLPLDSPHGAQLDDAARLRAVASLGTAEIAGRLASAGLSGLVDHVVAAVEALPRSTTEPFQEPEGGLNFVSGEEVL